MIRLAIRYQLADITQLQMRVWDEDITTHNTTSSAGEALQIAEANTPVSAGDIVDAVWAETTAWFVRFRSGR